jgi:hypothetical protein
VLTETLNVRVFGQRRPQTQILLFKDQSCARSVEEDRSVVLSGNGERERVLLPVKDEVASLVRGSAGSVLADWRPSPDGIVDLGRYDVSSTIRVLDLDSETIIGLESDLQVERVVVGTISGTVPDELKLSIDTAIDDVCRSELVALTSVDVTSVLDWRWNADDGRVRRDWGGFGRRLGVVIALLFLTRSELAAA